MDTAQAPTRRGLTIPQVLAVVLLVMVLTAAATFWFLRSYVYAREFQPVQLSLAEQATLDDKLVAVGLEPEVLLPQAKRSPQAVSPPASPADHLDADGRLEPQAYSETGASREIDLSERELNALLASNPDLARRFAVDLSNNLASARLVIPVDPDFPVLGGKTLRVNAGLELAYAAGQPVVILRGVSVMGVPVPNAWLGGLKNVDLVQQFAGHGGPWQAFADGVEHVRIEQGRLRVKLKE